ncbi:MAG: class I SAM-dependent RNA methyltransferase [Anaerolineales bacterium]|nr:class I SAM-dependent RNA methyltransferase [Anaerolineales bacterium]
MAEQLTLTLTGMAHGGSALGRDENGRVIFVPLGIPGETVRVEIRQDKNRYAQGRLLEVLTPAASRVEPRCPHFGICGNCHLQHIAYATQLELKHQVVVDQLNRLGGLSPDVIRPVRPQPDIWNYQVETSLSPVKDGGLGYWSPVKHAVFPLETCHLLQPELLALLEDIDLELPGLRKLTLRLGDDEAMLAAFEITGVEPPSLELDFPLSVAIVLPDRTTANLIGDNFVVQAIKGRDFRVTAGCEFPVSLAGAALLVEAVQELAGLTGAETVLELYSGVGLLTAFLAPAAEYVIGIEQNPDAIQDAAVNLEDTENVALYEGLVEEILPDLEVEPELIVLDPPARGVPADVLAALTALAPERIIYVSEDVATLARDGQALQKGGYRPVTIQPIDMLPQHFQVHTVSLWQKER